MTDQKIESFQDLDVWKLGHQLVLDVYQLTKWFPNEERFGLVSQMRRAAVSITSNIAEGFGRWSPRDKSQFYTIAKGSLIELHNQLIISKDVQLIDQTSFKDLEPKLIRVQQTISGLIRSTTHNL